VRGIELQFDTATLTIPELFELWEFSGRLEVFPRRS
jgi:hypothetical protein